MKKKHKIAISVIVSVVVVCLLAAIITGLVIHLKKVQENEKFQNIVDESVTLTISYDRILSDKEYEDIQTHVNYIPNIPDGYDKAVKLTLKMQNNSNCNLYGFFITIDNGNIYMVSECIDIEPTFRVEVNSEIEVSAYAYINNDLKTEQDIKNALKNTYFTYEILIDNSDKPIEPHEVTIKAIWQDETEKVNK